MSVNLVRASSQSLANLAFPIAAPPVSFGFWLKRTSDNTANLISISDDAGAARAVIYTLSGQFNLYTTNGTSAAFGDATNVSGLYYILLRVIAGDNVRADILEPSGAISSVAATISLANTFAFTRFVLGSDHTLTANTEDGRVSELFYTNSDIHGDGGAVSSTFLRQLAFKGPGSIQRVRKDIIEYRSFRTHPTAGHRPDIHFGPKGPQAWTNTGGATIGPHPPHAQPWNRSYIRPGQSAANRVAYVPDEVVAPSASARAQRGGFIANVGGLMGRF